MTPGSRPGLFITLEGGEGSGKSTQARALVARLRAEGHIACPTEEPMGTPLGRAVKGLFERQARSEEVIVSDWAELFLFESARAQHVRDVIRPALERGDIVVCDRFGVACGIGEGSGFYSREQCLNLCHGTIGNHAVEPLLNSGVQILALWQQHQFYRARQQGR